jgi:hypothetical protein
VQDLYLSGCKKDAAAAIPTSLVEEVAVIGPSHKIRDELAVWRRSLLTTLVVSAPAHQLRTSAEITT